MRNIIRVGGTWLRDLKNTLQRLKKAIPSMDGIRIPSTNNLPLDKAAEIIAGLGIPGLVLTILMAASPWFGAAAITASLAALGPFGMLGGIATLGILAFISRSLAEFGFEKVFRAVLIKLREDGKTCEEIRAEINEYPISKELKRKLEEFIEEFCEGENHEQ